MSTIIINSPIMQKQIQKIVETMTDPKCTFVKKDGIKLYFETDMEDKDEACKRIKAEIKKDPMAGAIMFTVKADEYI
ncbi:hypothetical protein [Erysipelothrix rhusiopathiae]|uniref:hypothetical protein n=1 Tax=Erysipelothrix rhusiopathiae TaxID=1648 RepID=UPI002B240BB4|nr:hypothetical protein [Erysipelothrix rhusiopathiae]WRB92409.1 hypothetical protein LL063_05465 [Erysipelothrix rhusiopathiae]